MPSPPHGFAEIQRQEVNRLFGRVVGVRLLFVPVMMTVAVALAWTDPRPWRTWLVGLTAVLAFAFFAVEAVRARRVGIERLSLRLNLAVAAVGTACMALGTGGLGSPLVFVLPVLAVTFGVFLDPPAIFVATGIQVVAAAAFAGLALAGGSPVALPVLGGASRLSVLVDWGVLTFLLVGSAGLGRVVRKTFDGMVRRALSAQEESLQAWQEREAELSALSAEIAHELKNPLASVKGLAALLAPGMADPRSAERLSVLRREVDRLQSILDEFLNFSRPLVPLTLGSADIGAIAREVAMLHEGMARDLGVVVEVRGSGRARCDPRKVKQVLINLVQNALDVSPPGQIVAIEVQDGAETARLSVLDRGPGLDPAVEARVFEPGVTTKAGGSGLGLTVSRAIARQHGGELRLAPRDGGGLRAELTLPSGAVEAAA
ncbi:MAG: HAMP domain-containing sensor histidine kinase [Deltaproteobacteria bacterium]